MQRTAARVLTLAFIAAAPGWRGCPASALSRKPSAPTAVEETERATSVFEDVTVAGEDPDGTVWRVRAERGWGRETEKSGSLQDVRVVLRKNGKELELVAGSADIDQGEGFHLADGVLITWDDYWVRVDHATYLKGRGVVTSAAAVDFEGPGVAMTGKGVEVKIESRVVRIAEDASARFAGEKP